MVALCFCDNEYKQEGLHVPEEFSDINIIDISITKAYVERPIHFSVFLKMSSWLLEEFNKDENSIFTFICSVDELDNNHRDMQPQTFRWELFDALYRRKKDLKYINIQDVIVGPEGYQSYGRAFYRDRHAPIVRLIGAYLEEKQHQ